MQNGSLTPAQMMGRPEDDASGIGIFLAPNRKDGAAFQSKEIEVGDLLVQVNGTALEGMQINEVRKLITGPPDSRIDVQLLRPFVDQESGAESLNSVYVSLRRSASTNILLERDLSPQRFGSPVLAPDHSSSMHFSNPRIGQAYAEYTPRRTQAGVIAPSQRRAPMLLHQNQNGRHQSPSRGPGPQYNGVGTTGISMSGVLTDPSRVSGSPTQLRAAPGSGIYGTDPQYTTVRRSISVPEPRRSWPAPESWDQGTARIINPQTSVSPTRKRGLSPGAPGIGLFGVGIVLQNDSNGDLRVVDITPGGPADSQGCPFQPGDIVVSFDGKIVRSLPALQAREMVLGRHGTPIHVKVLRPRIAVDPRMSGPALFQPLAFILYRGVRKAGGAQQQAVMQGSWTSSARTSVRTPSPSPVRPPLSPRSVPLNPSQRSVAVNEHMCGIGVFIERVRGSLVVKHINPQGPAGQVPPTYLFPGDYLVAIDGQHTQSMTMKEVRDKIVGMRGTYVTLSLRRFMPSTASFSHVFETRIQRELPPKSVSREQITATQTSATARGPMLSRDENEQMKHTIGSDTSDTPRFAVEHDTLSGVGIELIEVDQVLMVKNVQAGSPADRSGLISPGDVLQRVDYQAVQGLAVAHVMSLLRGPAGSTVVVGLVKLKHRLRVNVRLTRDSRQVAQAPSAQMPRIQDAVLATPQHRGPAHAVRPSTMPRRRVDQGYAPLAGPSATKLRAPYAPLMRLPHALQAPPLGPGAYGGRMLMAPYHGVMMPMPSYVL